MFKLINPSGDPRGLAVCRICLEEDFELNNLFRINSIDNQSSYQKLMTCVPSITVSEVDEFPNEICNRCSVALDHAYDFHLLALKSNDKLHRLEWKKFSVKQEQIDQIDDIDEQIFENESSPIDDKLITNHIEPTQIGKLINLRRKSKKKPLQSEGVLRSNKIRKNAAIRDANGKYIRRKKQIRIAKVKCEICEKMFWAKSHLERHIRIHTGERPFVCETCGKSFNFLDSLNRHTEIHDENRSKNFKCQLCSFKTAFLHDYKSHLIVHSGETPFTCDICTKKFNRKGNLDAHIRYMHSEPSITCEFCQEKFRTQGGLRVHIVRHYRTVQYECAVCKHAFSRHDGLVKHMKKFHPGIKWPSKAESRLVTTNNDTK